MLRSPNPHFKQLVETKFQKNNFSRFIGFQLTDISDGSTAGILPIDERHLQQNNFVHGGILLTLCDIVAGFAAFTMVHDHQHVVTANINVSCLRPGVGEKLIAKGWVLKPGKKIFFCESEIYAVNGGEEKLVAKSSSSMAVMDVKEM